MTPDPATTFTVLSCGDAFGAGGRDQAAFFWRTPHVGILIDCGATTLPAMRDFFVLRVKNHLTYSILKTHLPLLSCKRILLTHLDDEMLAVAGTLPLQRAHDGLVLTV